MTFVSAPLSRGPTYVNRPSRPQPDHRERQLERPEEQPQIHVEERRLSLHDFLKTSIKINGSDVHLQAGSLPMIRVDGRPRFLDCGPLSDDTMKEYVHQIIQKQAEPPEKQEILDKRGSVDIAYALEGLAASAPTSSTAGSVTRSSCGGS